jgi:hypothetical protein
MHALLDPIELGNYRPLEGIPASTWQPQLGRCTGLPGSALAGGTLLVIADTLARTLMAPRQLPVGALTAAIGVPLFLILMSRGRHTRYQ